MTNEQKHSVQRLRAEGMSFSQIGKELHLPVSTIKSLCKRLAVKPQADTSSGFYDSGYSSYSGRSNNAGRSNNTGRSGYTGHSDDNVCRCCGSSIEVEKGHRPRVFCSDRCRLRFWRERKRSVGA